jgi:hypothetical protein
VPERNSSRINRSAPATDAPLPRTGAVPLGALRPYGEAVLAEMAKNRDVKGDAGGKPVATLCSWAEDQKGTRLHWAADFSGIGMATDMPLMVAASADAEPLAWNFGTALIATTPREATPKEAADILEMNTLLAAFRRFVVAENVLFSESTLPRRRHRPT